MEGTRITPTARRKLRGLQDAMQEMSIAFWLDTIPNAKWGLGYSLICEFARLVEKENHVDIFHQLLLVDSLDALMPPLAFGGRLTKLTR